MKSSENDLDAYQCTLRINFEISSTLIRLSPTREIGVIDWRIAKHDLAGDCYGGENSSCNVFLSIGGEKRFILVLNFIYS
jgi:hypothetical protein